MIKQTVFAIVLIITLTVFGITAKRLFNFFKLTKPAFPVRNIGRRIILTLKVAFLQTKILRRPVVGMMHALVWWGFLVILAGSIEMVIDGLTGTERVFKIFGVGYDIVIATGDIFALLIAVLICAFLIRRIFMKIRRFEGVEMKHKFHVDATFALSLILFLMITLLGMNTFYIFDSLSAGTVIAGTYPVSSRIAVLLAGHSAFNSYFLYQLSWWGHILGIFFFANYLPYSKHFHVFMSVPNVFLSNLAPVGKMTLMEDITKEVKIMMNPDADYNESDDDSMPEHFGICDIEDITWKNYLDSLACTQCGRCTSVCPANITGKLLSPRKIIMNVRERMSGKGPAMIKNGNDRSDGKALLGDYITAEELWACTTCNACVQECPINIDQPAVILDMRRYLVMEQSAAPAGLNQIFSNLENNGAPWQFSQEDRMLWAEDLYINKPAGEIID